MPKEQRGPCAGRPLLLFLAAAAAAWTISIGLHAAPLLESARQRPAAEPPDLPQGEGSRILRERCLACHGPEMIVEQRLSRDAWGREVDKMIGWGAVVDDVDRGRLLDYLSARFGDPTRARVSVSPEGSGAALIAKRCLTCHDTRLIEEQRLTAAGWTRTVDKMIGWGASVSDSEKALLIEHLAAQPAPVSR